MNLEALAELRSENLCGPHLPGTLASPAFHLGLIQAALKHGGTLEHLGNRAFVLGWIEPADVGPRAYLMAHVEAGDPAALQWCLRALERVLPTLDETLEVTLGIRQEALWRHLLTLGLGFNAVNLAGRTDLALQRLVQAYDPPATLPGLQVRGIEPSDADVVVELVRASFTDEPIYHSYGAHPASLKRIRAKIEQPDGRRRSWVIEEDGRVQGMFEVAHIPSCPHHGSAAGTGLVLAPALRGRKIAIFAYRQMLEHLVEQELAWIKGTTGRQSVLHLARVMGRGVTGVVLRRTFVFEPGWFDTMLPPR